MTMIDVNMKGVDFWLHYEAEHYETVEHTWDWAFFVAYDGEIFVRNGPWFIDTGIYATKRQIKGCVWE